MSCLVSEFRIKCPLPSHSLFESLVVIDLIHDRSRLWLPQQCVAFNFHFNIHIIIIVLFVYQSSTFFFEDETRSKCKQKQSDHKQREQNQSDNIISTTFLLFVTSPLPCGCGGFFGHALLDDTPFRLRHDLRHGHLYRLRTDWVFLFIPI